MQTDWLAVIRGSGLRLRKSRGQSIIVDGPTLDSIVESWEIGPEDDVFEIGTGPGNLTSALAARARRVWSLEIDAGLAGLARRTVHAKNIIWIEGDALEFMRHCVFGQPMRVVGNLPYSVYHEMLLSILEWRSPVADMAFTLQEDVVRKLTTRGPMSVLLQDSHEVVRGLRVPRNRFYPQPRVDSACIRLIPRAERHPVEARRLERGLKRIFAAKGRTLGAFAKKEGVEPGAEGSIRIAEASDAVLLDLAERITMRGRPAS